MDELALRHAADQIIEASLKAADPEQAVRQHLTRVSLESRGRLTVIAVGKASARMAHAALGLLGNRVGEGIIVQPHGYEEAFRLGAGSPAAGPLPFPAHVTLLSAGHPVPDQAGLKAAERILQTVKGMGEKDLCLLLLSGGGSSLLPLPLGSITLDDKRRATELLLRSGADIHEINIVRKHLSRIKGGWLAEACRGRIITLAISDVVGDDPSIVASGPTVADPATFQDARDVLSRRGILDEVPPSVRHTLEEGIAGALPETPKSIPGRHSFAVIASNRLAVDAAAVEAARIGFSPLVLTNALTGEARQAGSSIASTMREAQSSGRPIAPPACLIAGGETTVTVRGRGKGGRNQELALSAAMALKGGRGLLLSAFATDGKEGNTAAAGAHASGGTLERGITGGGDPGAALESNDSFTFLSAAGELIITGPTGTNVNDVVFALVAADSG